MSLDYIYNMILQSQKAFEINFPQLYMSQCVGFNVPLDI